MARRRGHVSVNRAPIEHARTRTHIHTRTHARTHAHQVPDLALLTHDIKLDVGTAMALAAQIGTGEQTGYTSSSPSSDGYYRSCKVNSDSNIGFPA
jgi:hypothetical protein